MAEGPWKMWMNRLIWLALTLPREYPESELSIWLRRNRFSSRPLLAPPAPETEIAISPDLGPPTRPL